MSPQMVCRLQFHKNDFHPQYLPAYEDKRLFYQLNFLFANIHELHIHKQLLLI